MRSAILSAVLLLMTTSAFAQTDAAKARVDKLGRIASGEVPVAAAQGDPTAPASVASADAETQKAYQASLREYYAYRTDGLRHRRRVFGWQLVTSKVIFVVVLMLVAAGMYFAAVQFHIGLRRREKMETSEISASLEGVKVSSPVLGVIILVISLAFFYCYLVFVYPIVDIF